MAVRLNRWIMGVGVPVLAAAQTRGDDQVGYGHESYVEDHGRMSVNTDTLRVQKTLTPWLDVTAKGVYDAISGATPTGAPAINQLHLRQPQTGTPVPNSAITGFVSRNMDAVSGASPGSAVVNRNAEPLADSRDIRRGFDVSAGLTFGSQKFVPEFSYSEENDYISYAGALNYSLELNQKNTVLNAGWTHSYDHVLANSFTFITDRAIKNSDEYIIGLTQILGPKTIFNISGTIGHSEGYLNDPYRTVVFDETSLDPNARAITDGEKRPSTRDSQSVYLSLTQAVTAMNASVEGSYRFYHDSYGIVANTVGLSWFQKLGSSIVVSPSIRYYRQGAAHFYGVQFPGDPVNDPARVPGDYSSDYRLSFLETWTVGIDASIKVHDQWDLRLGYQRYWMHGLDHQTLQSVYPGANVFTIGLTYHF
jgi:hypothetical protein